MCSPGTYSPPVLCSDCITPSQKELSQAHLPVQLHAFIDRHCNVASTFETQTRVLDGVGVQAIEAGGGATTKKEGTVSATHTGTPVVTGKLESRGDAGAMASHVDHQGNISNVSWHEFAESRSAFSPSFPHQTSVLLTNIEYTGRTSCQGPSLSMGSLARRTQGCRPQAVETNQTTCRREIYISIGSGVECGARSLVAIKCREAACQEPRAS
jgi:hypothetical protein